MIIVPTSDHAQAGRIQYCTVLVGSAALATPVTMIPVIWRVGLRFFLHSLLESSLEDTSTPRWKCIKIIDRFRAGRGHLLDFSSTLIIGFFFDKLVLRLRPCLCLRLSNYRHLLFLCMAKVSAAGHFVLVVVTRFYLRSFTVNKIAQPPLHDLPEHSAPHWNQRGPCAEQ